MISSLHKKIKSITKLGELIFFPSFCELCSSLLELPEEKIICHSCWGKIIPFTGSHCLCCGRFFEAGVEPHLCPDCVQKRPPFSCHRSYGRYGGRLKDAILLYKYRKFQILGRDFARIIHHVLGKDEDIWWKADFIVPVPLHPKRQKKRGFNQAQVIAQELARLIGVEIANDVLVKVKNAPPQTFLELEERAENVSGAFSVVNKRKIRRKVVILVDDVFTTGSTLNECSSVLKKSGVGEVRALTLAQA